MTFLYLPSIARINLADNDISYVYKFAFYRVCSAPRRRISVSLRANRLETDVVWKLLTTFDHVEHRDCHVAVDLRDNDIERFLTSETREFVVKRADAAATSPDAEKLFQHFRQWTHLTVDLAGNHMHCDCSLATEMRSIDVVLRTLHNDSQAEGEDFVTTAWRRLNCTHPAQYAHVTVGTYVDEMSVSRCSSQSTGSACLSTPTTLNCSNLHLSQFRLQTSPSHTFNTIDLSHNSLKTISYDELSDQYPVVHTLLLHDNALTSLPPWLVDGPVTSLTLAGNPLSCDCRQAWLRVDSVTRLAAITHDWDEASCSDGRPLSSAADRCQMLGAGHVALPVAITVTTMLTVVVALSWSARWLIRRHRVKVHECTGVTTGRFAGTSDDIVVVCSTHDVAWTQSHLLPQLRRCSTFLPTTDCIKVQPITGDWNHLTRLLVRCKLVVVVVTRHLSNVLSTSDSQQVTDIVDTLQHSCVLTSPSGAYTDSLCGRQVDIATSDVDITARLHSTASWPSANAAERY